MVPAITPVAGSIVSPAGRPAAVKVKAPPSMSAKLPAVGIEMPWPSLADWSAIGVATTGASLTAPTVIVTVAVSVPPWPSLT